MEIELDSDELNHVYEGTTSMYQPAIVKAFIKTVNSLKGANRFEDLFKINSLNFKALSGKKNGHFSVRVNDKYRAEFSIRKENGKDIITITKLSNHYK